MHEIAGVVLAQFQTSGISMAIAAGALIVSIVSYRRSGPRISVNLSTPIIIDPKFPRWHGRAAVIVKITNDGASPMQVQGVYLESPAGRVYGESQPEKGIELPYSLEARGGQLVWLFDRQQLRNTARRDAGESQVAFRAVVESGSARYKSKDVEVVHPLEPRRAPRRKTSLRGRTAKRLGDLFSPRPQVEGLALIDSVDLKQGTYGLRVKNFGGGVARGATVELLRHLDSGSMERIGQPIPVGAIVRHRTVTIAVPLQEEEELYWYLRYKGRVRAGAGAMTWQEALELQKNDS